MTIILNIFLIRVQKYIILSLFLFIKILTVVSYETKQEKSPIFPKNSVEFITYCRVHEYITSLELKFTHADVK